MIEIEWEAFDGNGVANWNLWVLANGTWTNIFPTNTTGNFPITLNYERDVQFALRATDSAGNTSDFGYLTPCLTSAG